MALALGPWSGTYRPDYNIVIYKNGDPSNQLTGVNLRSMTSIQTNKNLNNTVGMGTFNFTMKDRRAQDAIEPMDVVIIKMKGHNQGWDTVLKGLVDTSEPVGNAQVSSSEADVIVSGRCMGKYLQSNSMFLPVWDPTADLPTALTFGLGDATNKIGTNVNDYTPRAIFGYIFDHYVVGLRNRVGLSGIPNARFWMDRTQRFEWVRDSGGKMFQVPFIQFDEDTCDTALTQLVVQGFTEGWVDELGRIVYRPPQWDGAVSWNVSAEGLVDWDLPKTDVGMATYVEVFPAGLPQIPSGVQQAMMAGRAPIPSDYLTGLRAQGQSNLADRDFIIDTDSTGHVTATGLLNWYYQKQKKYGLRPYQISSPLLATRQQAQDQAEGLLRFMLRKQKSGTIVIPGEPSVRVGTTIYLHGRLKDQRITRTYYIDGVAHEYVEGDHYTTTLTLSHGRDPGDPSWQKMMLPNLTSNQLADYSGILNQATPASTASDTSFVVPGNVSAARQSICQIAVGQVGGSQYEYQEVRPMPSSLLDNPCITDCSGFSTLVYKMAGVPDPNGFGYNGQGNTGSLEANGVPTTSPQPGDLCFWSSPDHAAVYIGNGQIVEFGGPPAPSKSTVAAESAYHAAFLGYRSYLS